MGEDDPQVELNIEYSDDGIQHTVLQTLSSSTLELAVKQTLRQAGIVQPVTLSLLITDDETIHSLNKQYRQQDKPTDVLSFPSDEAGYLGDVVISSGVAVRQAHAAGHSVAVELRVLALHGLLHLLGYDHERDDGQMARLERRLRRQGGLREGLIERA